MAATISLRPDIDRPIRFQTPQSSRSPSPSRISQLPRTSFSHSDLEAMTVPLSKYPTKARHHGDSRLSIVASNTGRDGMIRRTSRGSVSNLYRFTTTPPRSDDGEDNDDEDEDNGVDGVDDSEINLPITSNSSIYSRVSNRVRKDTWAEIDDYAAETADIMRRLNSKLVISYDQEDKIDAKELYEANMDLLRFLKERHKTLDELMESANLAQPRTRRSFSTRLSRGNSSYFDPTSALTSPMTVTFQEPFSDSGGGAGGGSASANVSGRTSPITLWGEEKERRLQELETQLKEANRNWSPKQEDILEEIEVLREERRKAKKLRRMTAPVPERRGSTFSLKSIGSFKKSKSRRGSTASNGSKKLISTWF